MTDPFQIKRILLVTRVQIDKSAHKLCMSCRLNFVSYGHKIKGFRGTGTVIYIYPKYLDRIDQTV